MNRHTIYFRVKNEKDNKALLQALGFIKKPNAGFVNGSGASARVPWSKSVHIFCDEAEYNDFHEKAWASGLLDIEHDVNYMTFTENVQNKRYEDTLVNTYLGVPDL